MASDPQVIAIIGGIQQYAEKLMKKLTLDITANLIEDTPVDTGWARANWVPQVASPFGGDSSFDHSFSNRNGKTAALGGQTSIQGEGLSSIISYSLQRGTIYITNNVPYITKLNEGSSAKAPAAFVQAAIARAVQQNTQATVP